MIISIILGCLVGGVIAYRFKELEKKIGIQEIQISQLCNRLTNTQRYIRDQS